MDTRVHLRRIHYYCSASWWFSWMDNHWLKVVIFISNLKVLGDYHIYNSHSTTNFKDYGLARMFLLRMVKAGVEAWKDRIPKVIRIGVVPVRCVRDNWNLYSRYTSFLSLFFVSVTQKWWCLLGYAPIVVNPTFTLGSLVHQEQILQKFYHLIKKIIIILKRDNTRLMSFFFFLLKRPYGVGGALSTPPPTEKHY